MGKRGSNTHNKSVNKTLKTFGGNRKYLVACLNSVKKQLCTVYQSIADIKNDGERSAVPEGNAQLMLLLAEAPKGSTSELIEWLRAQLVKAKKDLAIYQQTAADNAADDADAAATAADVGTVADAAATATAAATAAATSADVGNVAAATAGASSRMK